MNKKKILALVVGCMCWCFTAAASSDPLADGFWNPPNSAKPWTYWFWINGNITREGIKADLEAMARVGIHGVLIMEVAKPNQPNRMAPAGPVAFGSLAWRELFGYAVTEAGRLGMEISMNNDAGWAGSGGPWNTPEFSMQKLVWTSLAVLGSRHFEEMLLKPTASMGYYHDIKVLAYPAPVTVLMPSVNPFPSDRIIDLTSKVDTAGKLGWAILLLENGDITFSIGSISDHSDIVASKVYEADKEVKVTCTYNRGEASIYINNQLVAKKSGIKHDTKDVSAAGRLGTVGAAFQAVGDVILKTEETDGVAKQYSKKIKNFRGTISNLKVYNRSVKTSELINLK